MANPEKYQCRKSFIDDYGIRHYVRGSSLAECERKIAILRAEIMTGRQVVDGSTKVAQWSAQWLTVYKEKEVSTSWYKDMTAMMDNRIIPIIGNMKVKDVKPLHAQRVLNEMSGYSESYIRKVYNIMHEMFSDAVRNQMMLRNPCESVSIPKTKPAEERRALSDHEVSLLLEALDGHRGNIFCKLMLYCGLRPSEVCALRWSDIDFKTARLSVNKAMKKDGTIGSPKSKAGVRVVPVPLDLLGELAEVKHNPFDLVAPQMNGKMQTKTTIRKMWASIKKRMDILNGAVTFRDSVVVSTLNEPLVIYDLRHTYCTHLQEAGVPIDVARRLMGHSSIELTSRIYTHGSEEVLDSAAELINQRKKSPKFGTLLAHTMGTNGDKWGQ